MPEASAKPPLIRALLADHACYDHPVSHVQLVETHISWVLLTGKYAYKIKKPLNLGFLDFSTLELRQQACIDEIHLNRRLAATFYLGVAAITGSMAEAKWGVPDWIKEEALGRLDEALLNTFESFTDRYCE